MGRGAFAPRPIFVCACPVEGPPGTVTRACTRDSPERALLQRRRRFGGGRGNRRGTPVATAAKRAAARDGFWPRDQRCTMTARSAPERIAPGKPGTPAATPA